MGAPVADIQAYKKTPVFNETTVPKGLLANHSTAKGVWGKICVLAGELILIYEAPSSEAVSLKKGGHGWVNPQQLHRVQCGKNTEFYVEFYKKIKKT